MGGSRMFLGTGGNVGASGSGGTAGGGGGGGGGGGTGGGVQGGAAGMGGNGGTNSLVPIGEIGAPCSTDADCYPLAGFTCIESTSNVEFGGGGPEGGYCTVPCSNSDECEALDGASVCGEIDPATQRGHCFGLCLAGDNPNAKCGANRAQACLAFPDAAPVGACIPMCTSDSGCGSGRFCAPGGSAVGLCVDTAPAGGGIGAPCTPQTEVTDCASGVCLTFEGAPAAGGFCTANCTYLSDFGCGRAAGTPQTTPRDTFCLQAQAVEGAPGDLGFCFELCDVAADCAQPDWVCEVFGTADVQEALGRLGQCVPPELLAQ